MEANEAKIGAALPTEQPDAAKRAIAAYLDDMAAMMQGTGQHEDHEQHQVGRCVVCSCGMRVQGRLEARRA